MAQVHLDQWRVPLADVRVRDDVLASAQAAIASGWWSMGPRVADLEAAFAERIGAAHALAVANGTAALHLALLAVGCRQGDDVVLPSLNFVAAANTVVHAGARPVFCDIVGDGDLNLDPSDLEAAIGPQTRALVVLHYGGFACDLEAVVEIARRRGVAVIEDAAHAPGSTHEGRGCGTVGDIGCFSFFSNKNLAIGEGGMIVTNDDALAERLRLLRSHGMTTLTWDRHRGHASGYDVVLNGFNYRLDEVHAAMAHTQLGHLAAENQGRRELAARYRERLHGRAGLGLAFADRLGSPESSHHLVVALLPDGTDRGRVREKLTADRIQTSVHYPPIHRFSAFGDGSRALPRTDAVADRILTLPLFGHMTQDQLELVATSLEAALAA